MTTEKQLGIWMDHSSANLMEFTNGEIVAKVIPSALTHHEKEETHGKGDHLKAEYYKKIGEEIKKYDSVLLFGPTTAKSELMNTFNGDHHFENIKIHSEQSDKLTDNQQHAFVRHYFSKN